MYIILYSLAQREHESWMAAVMQFINHRSSYIPFAKSYIYVYDRIFPLNAGARVTDSTIIYHTVCISHRIFRSLIVYSPSQREHESWMAAVMQFINVSIFSGVVNPLALI